MFDCCSKAATIFSSSLDEEALMEGITDVIVVRHKSGSYTSTQFFASFGSLSILYKGKPIEFHINKTLVSDIKFTLDKYGYVHPTVLSSNQLKSLHLKFGLNTMEFRIG